MEKYRAISKVVIEPDTIFEKVHTDVLYETNDDRLTPFHLAVHLQDTDWPARLRMPASDAVGEHDVPVERLDHIDFQRQRVLKLGWKTIDQFRLAEVLEKSDTIALA